MKIKIVLIILLSTAATPKAKAGWFDNGKEHQEKLVEVEHQLTVQRKATDQWEVISGILGIGCVLLFVIGTAIGAKTRHASTKPQ